MHCYRRDALLPLELLRFVGARGEQARASVRCLRRDALPLELFGFVRKVAGWTGELGHFVE